MYFHVLNDMPELNAKPGVKIKEVSLNNVMMTFMEFEPQTVLPPHKHEHEQITVVIQGSAKFTVNGESKILNAGDVCSIPSFIEHSVQIMDDFTIMYDSWSPVREDYLVKKD